jgi:hypothetical protein
MFYLLKKKNRFFIKMMKNGVYTEGSLQNPKSLIATNY